MMRDDTLQFLKAWTQRELAVEGPGTAEDIIAKLICDLQEADPHHFAASMLAEQVLHGQGMHPVDYIFAQRIRERLEELGRADLGAKLSDEDIASSAYMRSDSGLMPPLPKEYHLWRHAFDHAMAAYLVESEGEIWPEEI